MNWTWRFVAEYCEKEYGVYVDWDEGFFVCPECAEPLYEVDWFDHVFWNTCPICGFDFTEGE